MVCIVANLFLLVQVVATNGILLYVGSLNMKSALDNKGSFVQLFVRYEAHKHKSRVLKNPEHNISS